MFRGEADHLGHPEHQEFQEKQESLVLLAQLVQQGLLVQRELQVSDNFTLETKKKIRTNSFFSKGPAGTAGAPGAPGAPGSPGAAGR